MKTKMSARLSLIANYRRAEFEPGCAAGVGNDNKRLKSMRSVINRVWSVAEIRLKMV